MADAIDVLSATSRGIGYIHVVDGRGDMAGIESVYDDHAIMNPEQGVLPRE